MRLMSRTGLAAVAVTIALSCASCGSSSSSAVYSPSSSSPSTSYATTGTAPATSTSSQTTGGLSQSSVPQLVVCGGGNFYAVPPDSSGTVTTPFAYGPTGSFSFANSNNPSGSCGTDADISPSPDFSKWAATSQTPDGSTVAGYVDANSASFTDLSGHTSSYSGATVTDSNVMFSPTGELWWNDHNNQVWYASPSGGAAVDYGSGQIGGFTPDGQPSPNQIFASPSGNVLMFADFSADADGLGVIVNIADANKVNGKCLEQATATSSSGEADAQSGWGDYSLSSACPGVANTSNLSQNTPMNACGSSPGAQHDCGFAGMISDSAFACLDSSGSSTYYESVPFTLSGTQITIGKPTQLTPPTQLSVTDIGVSPDGKTLWYELNQNDGSSTLYEVPTSGYSANPESFVPEISVGGQPTTVDNLSWEGWLWNSKFIPLQPPIQQG